MLRINSPVLWKVITLDGGVNDRFVKTEGGPWPTCALQSQISLTCPTFEVVGQAFWPRHSGHGILACRRPSGRRLAPSRLAEPRTDPIVTAANSMTGGHRPAGRPPEAGLNSV